MDPSNLRGIRTPVELLSAVENECPAALPPLQAALAAFRPRFVVNQVREPADARDRPAARHRLRAPSGHPRRQRRLRVPRRRGLAGGAPAPPLRGRGPRRQGGAERPPDRPRPAAGRADELRLVGGHGRADALRGAGRRAVGDAGGAGEGVRSTASPSTTRRRSRPTPCSTATSAAPRGKRIEEAYRVSPTPRCARPTTPSGFAAAASGTVDAAGRPRPVTLPDPVTGADLKRFRESRGVTLAKIAADSKVGKRTFEDIEGDRFERLPAVVYVRGFLQEYARAVGLDPRATAESFLARLAPRGRHQRTSRRIGSCRCCERRRCPRARSALVSRARARSCPPFPLWYHRHI